ncbi:MAG: hypothetical protein GX625_18215 [Clostridiaceae bacterium]|nr:hypothetical protein [Clostridiaceae bacterium]
MLRRACFSGCRRRRQGHPEDIRGHDPFMRVDIGDPIPFVDVLVIEAGEQGEVARGDCGRDWRYLHKLLLEMSLRSGGG